MVRQAPRLTPGKGRDKGVTATRQALRSTTFCGIDEGCQRVCTLTQESPLSLAPGGGSTGPAARQEAEGSAVGQGAFRGGRSGGARRVGTTWWEDFRASRDVYVRRTGQGELVEGQARSGCRA